MSSETSVTSATIMRERHVVRERPGQPVRIHEPEPGPYQHADVRPPENERQRTEDHQREGDISHRSSRTGCRATCSRRRRVRRRYAEPAHPRRQMQPAQQAVAHPAASCRSVRHVRSLTWIQPALLPLRLAHARAARQPLYHLDVDVGAIADRAPEQRQLAVALAHLRADMRDELAGVDARRRSGAACSRPDRVLRCRAPRTCSRHHGSSGRVRRAD